MTKQTPSSLLLVATIAGGVGFVAFVALMVVGGYTVSPAAFLAGLVALGVAIFLFQGFHKASPADVPNLKAADRSAMGDVTREAGSLGREPGTAGVEPGSAGMGPTGPAGTPTIDRPLGPDATGNAAGGAPRASKGGMPDPAAGGVTAKEPDQGLAAMPAESKTRDVETGNEPAATEEKTSKAGASDTGTAETERSAETVPETKAPDIDTAKTTESAEREMADAPKWSSSQLSGSEELSKRTGTWRYEGERAASTSEPKGASDGAQVEIGTEPDLLSEPREGGGDDLKRISGIGPKLESLLHGIGIFHLDQIAGWSDQQVTWVDERLEGFKGRVRRDEWVRQAGELSASDRE